MNAKLSPINELNGIIPSLHTPFKNNKSIDYKISSVQLDEFMV